MPEESMKQRFLRIARRVLTTDPQSVDNTYVVLKDMASEIFIITLFQVLHPPFPVSTLDAQGARAHPHGTQPASCYDESWHISIPFLRPPDRNPSAYLFMLRRTFRRRLTCFKASQSLPRMASYHAGVPFMAVRCSCLSTSLVYDHAKPQYSLGWHHATTL